MAAEQLISEEPMKLSTLFEFRKTEDARSHSHR